VLCENYWEVIIKEGREEKGERWDAKKKVGEVGVD
jgi:hypothetical protein